jgi:hypothetical protein
MNPRTTFLPSGSCIPQNADIMRVSRCGNGYGLLASLLLLGYNERENGAISAPCG